MELHQNERYELEKDKYAAGNESEYDELMEDLVQEYQQGFYIVSKDVKDDVSEFIDYMSKIQSEGARLDKQMELAGTIIASMRADIGLGPIYTDQVNDED